jgi:phosphoglycerol transferase MdoB-like AlkP superfamily enzyme
LGFLWGYGLAERAPPPAVAGPFAPPSGRLPAARPDLVVVQSESFFDARRLWPGVAPGVMAAFDRLREDAWRHGLLDVPAWGANTVRTEFAFLSGLAPQTLGVHRFNPYRRLAGSGIPTLASHLRALGYQTVCVHPYPASFYRRDRLYPLMGFDAFIDIESFAGAERCGPYVGDAAVAEAVRRLLREAGKPLFVFAITMENHGPLHWEAVAAGDEARLYQNPPPPGFEDLTVWLRHAENAGRMLEAVREALEQSPREGWLCWYGDHVPILPKVYAATGFADSRTEYFLWRRGGRREGRPARDLPAWDLAAALLEASGLAAPGPGLP